MAMDRTKWEYKEIAEVTTFFDDGDWIESDDQSDDGIRLVQTGNIGNGQFVDKSERAKYISEDTFKRLRCKEVFKGDCLISRLPDPIGRSCVIPEMPAKMITAVDCTILRFKDLINPYFFVYVTQSKYYKEQINKFSTGATRKRISRKNLGTIKTPLPPIIVQQLIVTELDKINELIALKQNQLIDLDSLAQSLFYEMFGDPVVNEKGWSVTQLGDVCEVSSFKRVLIEDVVDNGIPFIRGTELMALSRCAYGESIDFTLFITPEHYERVKAISGVPKIGDLLIPSINAEGNVWILDTDEPRYYKDGRVLWVHVNEKVYSSQTLKYIMHILLKNTYSEMASGATFAELKLFVLRELKTILPPFSLQQSFAAKVAKIEAEKQRVKSSLKDLETLLASRMQYWFDN